MELLTLESFIQHLESFANKELLTTTESIKLQLIITELLVDYYVDFKLLRFLSRFLTQQTYDEIIEERNIEHQCGYILCSNTPKQMVRRLSMNSNGITSASIQDPGASTHYQISNRKPTMILPNTYLSQYCCKEHYQALIFYRNQLSNEAIFARNNIMIIEPFPLHLPTWYENSITCLEEVIAKHKELKQHGKSLSEVIAMMSGLSVADHETNQETNDLAKLIEDFEIVEKESNLVGDAPRDPYSAVGGVRGGGGVVVPEEDDEEDETGMASTIEGYVTNHKSFGGYVV